MKDWAGQIRKFLMALATAATTAISLGVLPDPWNKWVAIIVGIGGVYGVYAVPNAAAPGG